MSRVVIGVGNEFRRDDGVGAAVVQALRNAPLKDVRLEVVDAEPLRLIESWAGACLAVIVDAVRCHEAVPGRLHRIKESGLLEAAVSTHGLGVLEVVELARALNCLPKRLVVLAVEVDDVDFGVGLSSAVQAAVPSVAKAIEAELTGAP
jgi:hydrogenase maturation protease